MGRKTKFTPVTVREIVANIETGLRDRDAALSAGIAQSTFYAWLQEFPEFSEAITRASEVDAALVVAVERAGRTRRRAGYRGSARLLCA